MSFSPKLELKSFGDVKAAFLEKMNETASRKIETELIRVAIQSPVVPNLNIFAMALEQSAIVENSLVAKEAIARYGSVHNSIVLLVRSAENDKNDSLQKLRALVQPNAKLIGCLNKLDSSEDK